MFTSNKATKIRELLDSRDEQAVADYMKSDFCKKVFVMAGAGISTSAGIPDFRSPETGLYANLERLKLPFPEAVFEINYFRRNPVPFYTLAHELAPGRFRPTLSHSFIRLLSEKGLLHTHFTQNIDTLERRAGVPVEDIVEAHGSFATSKCMDCMRPYDSDKMKEMIRDKSIARCPHCEGLVKPDIVFFGEALPVSFHQSLPTLRSADLLIVMGTSLTVHPFASLTELVPRHCPRVLINLDPAGDIGERPNDIQLLGHCDSIVRKICKEMGWENELNRLWDATAETLDDEYNQSKTETPGDKKEETQQRKDSGQESGSVAQTPAHNESNLEVTRDEAQKLAEKVNAAMKLGDSTGSEAVAEEAEKLANQREKSDSTVKVGSSPRGPSETGDPETVGQGL